ncbi:hypothetical protein [Dactylosporangium sp. NPDC051541]|uniref:hypothetical protein n=1 Tax=Dactylosporangium sp. NPDC051541 TaxID=3363977 RepID=UPI003791AD8A
MAPLVGSSPRRVKRFLNVYRVAKARASLDRPPTEAVALLLLVALAVGLPTAVPELPSEPVDEPVTRWLHSRRGSFDPAGVRLDPFLARAEPFRELTCTHLAAWLPMVRGFVGSGSSTPG